MKIITSFVAFVFLLNYSFAQEMKIKYDIIMKSSNPEMQTQLQMSEGSTLTIYAKDDKSRVEMKMGEIMTTTTILDVAEKKGLILMEGMLGKQAATFEGDDFDKYHGDDSEVEIEYLDETKTILGYNCKKAVVYMEDEGGEMEFWYTEDIKVSDAFLGDYSKYGLPGVALEYGVDQAEMTMKFVAVAFETSIKDTKDLFELEIPEGYTEKSFKEIINMSGQ